MSAANATEVPLVWLLNDEGSSAASESRNMIRSNAAAWGHKTRRREKRAPIRSKLPLASDMHFNVFGPSFPHAKNMLTSPDHRTASHRYKTGEPST